MNDWEKALAVGVGIIAVANAIPTIVITGVVFGALQAPKAIRSISNAAKQLGSKVLDKGTTIKTKYIVIRGVMKASVLPKTEEPEAEELHYVS